MKKFAGKVAIITGGAAGIGGASARLLAEHGASVLIADINTAEAQANAETIRGAGGTRKLPPWYRRPSTTGEGSTSS